MKFCQYIFILSVLFVACDSNSNLMDNEEYTCENCSITITNVYKQLTPLEYDQNGYYHYLYNVNNASDYGTVYYNTTHPTTYVQWTSSDSFYVFHQGQTFWEPVINYGTYSDENGEGQQLFYLNETLIGDTLDIYGYYAGFPSIIDSIKVVID